VRGVVLDIEGTTTPVSFVYDALFPYARTHLRRYLRHSASSPEVREATRLLEQEHAQDDARGEAAPPWQDASPDAIVDTLAAYLEWLMDRDRKSPGLKLIQGHIWKTGYDDGTLRGAVYPDVKPALERWRGAGHIVAIYSSGSVLGQQLLFSHSTAGDLTPFINHYFDTGVGPKRAAESYRQIAGSIGLPAPELLFISDVVAELSAAKEAGMQTLLCVRETMTEPTSAGMEVIRGFDEVAS
jgi:enolase-phosphatase E1